MKKWISYFIAVFWIAGLLIVLGFSRSKQKNKTCSGMDIQIDHRSGNFFVVEEDIHAMVYHEIDTLMGRPIDEINSNQLEYKLNNHPSIERTEVYKTLEGTLKIEVIQRKPIVRIFNREGESFYLDRHGKPMPTSTKYTSRVMVANGYISDGLVDVHQSGSGKEADSSKQRKILEEIFTLAAFIHADKFWKAQIEQLYVNKELDFELIPRVGNHRIVFGDATFIEEKFNKLKIFYHEGLSKTGWNEYSVINLKYANQVVCKKRY